MKILESHTGQGMEFLGQSIPYPLSDPYLEKFLEIGIQVEILILEKLSSLNLAMTHFSRRSVPMKSLDYSPMRLLRKHRRLQKFHSSEIE